MSCNVVAQRVRTKDPIPERTARAWQVEVIVHCAANTGFHVPLEEILTTNTLGFMELLKLAGACKNLKARCQGFRDFRPRPIPHGSTQISAATDN